MTTRSTTHREPHLVCAAPHEQNSSDTAHSPAQEQPAATPKPDTGRGEPPAPTDKPLPDLPDPVEVGEDG